ncbi:hypothetical protein [Devosia nitrariae]|uniref:hypothetical protein n=1 Tax=Devosia nitrariae TaxID=2071872 RepID=UPI0024E07F9F|nr:hypothetical protein [Devosia nitrariae]
MILQDMILQGVYLAGPDITGQGLAVNRAVSTTEIIINRYHEPSFSMLIRNHPSRRLG